MTASLLQSDTDTVDPTGLGGQRVSRVESNKPHVELCYVYSSRHSIEQIREAWKALPRLDRTLVMAVTEFKKSEAGRRFVKVDLFVHEPAVPHVDEPPI